MSSARFRDVTLLHSSDGLQWKDYLVRTFQTPNLDISLHVVDVDGFIYENPPEIELSVRESYVVILLITCGFLEYMENNAHWFRDMLERRDSEITTILVVTLSRHDSEDCENVCCTNDYQYTDWIFKEIQVDGSNSHDTVMSVLTIADANRGKHRKPAPRRHKPKMCKMYPRTIKTVKEKIALVFFEEVQGEVTLYFKESDHDVTTTRINPYCVTFTSPVLKQGTYSVLILVNDVEKEELQIEYCSAEFTSVELMKQYYGVVTVDQLDMLLANQYRQSVCTDAILKRLVELTPAEQGMDISNSYSTALHWAAANGLKELSSQLMMSPCAADICNTLNCDGETVADLAEKAGHEDLKEYIYEYFETKQCADACDLYVQSDSGLDTTQSGRLLNIEWTINSKQEMKEKRETRELAGIAEALDLDRREDNHYTDMTAKHIPAALENYYKEMTPKDIPRPVLEDLDDVVYEDTPGVHVTPQKPPIPRRDRRNSEDLDNVVYEDTPGVHLAPQKPPIPSRDRKNSVPETKQDLQNAKREQSPRSGAVGCRSQNELIDIMDEVKSGTFSISEAEMLFNAWKERYCQGNAASFRGKQKALQQVRQKYKTTLSLLTKEYKKNLPPISGEGYVDPVISEPITPRKNAIAPRSQRIDRRSNDSPRTSDESVGARRSKDSGCDIRTDDETYDSTDGRRKSLANTYKELSTMDEQRKPPPLPPRVKKPPAVYIKRKLSSR